VFIGGAFKGVLPFKGSLGFTGAAYGGGSGVIIFFSF
jgi:hypothetical protein